MLFYLFGIQIILQVFIDISIGLAMGIGFSKLFACCCKDSLKEVNSPACSSTSSSSPQHLLSTSPTFTSEPCQKKDLKPSKLDASLSALYAKQPSIVHYRARLISLRPLALLIPNFLKPHECQVQRWIL